MFYVIYPELWQFSVKMEILDFINKEAAAPLMSVAAPLWFWKFGNKLKNLEFFSEMLKVLKIMKNFEKL